MGYMEADVHTTTSPATDVDPALSLDRVLDLRSRQEAPSDREAARRLFVLTEDPIPTRS